MADDDHPTHVAEDVDDGAEAVDDPVEGEEEGDGC